MFFSKSVKTKEAKANRNKYRGKHNAKAKKVADVGKVYVKVPTEQIDVIKNAKAGNAAHKGKRSINRLIDQLCGSVLIICILLFF